MTDLAAIRQRADDAWQAMHEEDMALGCTYEAYHPTRAALKLGKDVAEDVPALLRLVDEQAEALREFIETLEQEAGEAQDMMERVVLRSTAQRLRNRLAALARAAVADGAGGDTRAEGT